MEDDDEYFIVFGNLNRQKITVSNSILTLALMYRTFCCHVGSLFDFFLI